MSTRRSARFAVALTTAAAASLALVSAGAGPAAADASPAPRPPQASTAHSPAAPSPAWGHRQSGDPDLGPNVLVFDPSMSTASIRARIDAVSKQQVSNQFGRQRYSLLFKPGTYGTAADPLIVQVGYYTEVAGLGRNPGDVVINGHVDVYNQCFPTAPGAPSDCTALDNFWRSVSNLTIDVAGLDGCRGSADFWAVSQAAPMRRVDVRGGNLTLQDYCTDGPQYASGGFIADSRAGTVVNGSQQQFLTRNSTIGSWTNGVWNQVFAGVEGAPAQAFGVAGGAGPYTTLARTPASKEKPYLWVDGHGRWQVFEPSAQTNTRGTSWAGGSTPGRSIPLDRFQVVKPGEPVWRINLALALGRDLLMTPGVYDVDQTIRVTRPDTVVLGMGIASVSPTRGNVAMTVADVPGVDVAGLTFDAGAKNSPALLQVGGTRHGWRHGWSRASDPTALQDVFFRVGGPQAGRASTALVVNSDHVLLDDIWAWRADHGTGVGWTENTSATGVVVNGDDVTATGLFDEHFQRYNLVWNGERGKVVFFQNELPYDAPNQAAWSHGGQDGWAAYKVSDRVRTHEAWGLGSYIFTNVDPTLHASHGFEVPVRPGVQLHDLLTVSLNRAGTIDHVVNGTGDPVTPTVQGPSTVTDYPAR